MGMTCSVCSHAAHDAIDEAIVRSVPYREIAQRHGVSVPAISRHRQAHLSAALSALTGQRGEQYFGTLVDRLEELIDRFEVLAKGAGNTRAAVAALAEVRRTLELVARLTGELDESSKTLVVNIAASSEWSELRTLLLRALAPYPDARAAVVVALSGSTIAQVPNALPGTVGGGFE